MVCKKVHAWDPLSRPDRGGAALRNKNLFIKTEINARDETHFTHISDWSNRILSDNQLILLRL